MDRSAGAGRGLVPRLLALALIAAVPAPGLRAQSPGDTRDVPIPGTDLTVRLAFIPAGDFVMGSGPDEPGRDDDEGPAHGVRLPAFWMTVHEITDDLYAPFRHRNFDDDAGPDGPASFDVDAVTRPSPPYEDPAQGMGGGERPATGMTRRNALHYARWLSEKTGRLFRLPTEAEWEYACRAGGDGPWGSRAASGAVEDRGWLETNSGGVLHPVGRKPANPWGIRDLHGNAAEWVMDGYDPGAYAARAATGPVHDPMVGSPVRGQGLVRGGAFDDGPDGVRCAERLPESGAWKRRDPQIPKSRWWNTDAPHVGFRLVSPTREFTPAEIRTYWDELLGG